MAATAKRVAAAASITSILFILAQQAGPDRVRTPGVRFHIGRNGLSLKAESGRGDWSTRNVHVMLSTKKTEGWVELWHDEVQQTFTNGQKRYTCSTVDAKAGSFVLLKWGVYRSGSVNGKGPASAFMSRARIGTTYADVDPGDASAK
jgi:hypothetical protein